VGRPTKSKIMGRPPKQVDWKLFKSLCELHCSMEEICHVLDFNADVLREKIKTEYGCTFQEQREKFSAHGKLSLRRDQFRMAKRNAAMSIWLGKQYLQQKDVQHEIQVNEDVHNNYLNLMLQLSSLQSDRKMEESNINKEPKSE